MMVAGGTNVSVVFGNWASVGFHRPHQGSTPPVFDQIPPPTILREWRIGVILMFRIPVIAIAAEPTSIIKRGVENGQRGGGRGARRGCVRGIAVGIGGPYAIVVRGVARQTGGAVGGRAGANRRRGQALGEVGTGGLVDLEAGLVGSVIRPAQVDLARRGGRCRQTAGSRRKANWRRDRQTSVVKRRIARGPLEWPLIQAGVAWPHLSFREIGRDRLKRQALAACRSCPSGGKVIPLAGGRRDQGVAFHDLAARHDVQLKVRSVDGNRGRPGLHLRLSPILVGAVPHGVPRRQSSRCTWRPPRWSPGIAPSSLYMSDPV